MCRCISTVSVGRKVISASYSSAILPLPLSCIFILKHLLINHDKLGTVLAVRDKQWKSLTLKVHSPGEKTNRNR